MKRAFFIFLAGVSLAPIYAGMPPICREVGGALAEEVAWAEMGLTFANVDYFINPSRAHHPITFLMAIEAFNSLLFSQSPRKILVPAQADFSLLPPGKTVHSWGHIHVYELEATTNEKALWMRLRPTWRKLAERPPADIDFDGIRDWALARCDYAHEALLAANAINAALNEQNPHSRIEPNHLRELELAAPGDQIHGVGVQLVLERERLWVTRIVPGAAAEAAGVRPRDEVLMVDGVSVRGLTIEEAVERFRGREGEIRRLGLRRSGKTTEVMLTIRPVMISFAEGSSVDTPQGRLGVLTVRSFRSRLVTQQAADAIRAQVKRGVKGIVADLRGNGGGDVRTALEFLGLFLGPNIPVVSTRDLKTGERAERHTAGEKITDLPLVLLVDHRSASSAELVASVIQDQKRGFVVGERTFGKGTFHAPYEPNPNGPFRDLPVRHRQTYAMFSVASGGSPQLHGVLPDFVAPARPGAPLEENVLREGDLYNAFQNPEEPLRPRPLAEREEILRCLGIHGTADRKYYSPRERDFERADYRMLVAIDVLKCLLGQ